MKHPAVFLDRDGVLNRALIREGTPHPPASVAELEILPNVPEALDALRARGYALIVVTNQPDVARGTASKQMVIDINNHLKDRLNLDAVLTCFHDNADNCDCRKPRPGLLLRAAQDLGIDLSSSFMVGDRARDVEAGQRAGCRTFFVDGNYMEAPPSRCDFRVGSLIEAANIILSTSARQKVTLDQLNVKLFADGANKAGMLDMCAKPYIKGLTTNPTLMRKAGISDYRAFAREMLTEIRDKPISFEVLSDDFAQMEREALEIASWAQNVYVKIPVTNTRCESCRSLVSRLSNRKVKVNVTAVMTLAQVRGIVEALNPAVPSYVSIFAGRVADTGLDPLPLIAKALELLKLNSKAELVWASSREILNIFQADAIGCHVITVTQDILNKLSLIGYDLTQYSLDTVKMFCDDAQSAGFSLEGSPLSTTAP
jgi:transaldolase